MTEERVPEAGDDTFDDSPLDADESLEDFQKRTADTDDDELDDGGDLEDEETDEPPDADVSVDAVLNYINEQEALKTQVEAERSAFVADMESHLPGWQEPEPELSKIERVAQKVAGMDTNEFNKFKGELERANEKLAASYRAGTPGHDESGEPVAPPFDPTSLDSDGFAIYMRAAASGGAIARETPSGFTRESWAKAVSSSLAKE